MKVFAEIKDYRRFVGIHLTRPLGDNPHLEQWARVPSPEKCFSSIERQLEWYEAAKGNCMSGMESIMLPMEEVQLVFDALWDAGMRPHR